MFTPSDVEKVVYVVTEAKAVATLTALRNKIKSGAGTGLTMEIFLVGALLSALEGDGMVLTNLYNVLTVEMPFDWQVKLEELYLCHEYQMKKQEEKEQQIKETVKPEDESHIATSTFHGLLRLACSEAKRSAA